MPKRTSPTQKNIATVLDANLNRAIEGLRVSEEVARFVLEDVGLTRRFQRLRHDVQKTGALFPKGFCLDARKSASDVGRPSLRPQTRKHGNVQDLTSANLKRVQEALRVLEEFSRLESTQIAQQFCRLRFRSYELEQKIHQRF